MEVTEEGIKLIQKAPLPLQKRFFDRLKELGEEKITMILWALEILVDLLAPKKTPMQIPTHLAKLEQPEEKHSIINDI